MMSPFVSNGAGLLGTCGIFGLLLFILQLWKKKTRPSIKTKVILITGATSGVGKASAELFYMAGCRVILAARNLEHLKKIQQEFYSKKKGGIPAPPAILQLDLSNLASIPEKVTQAISFYGQIDVLINNAGQSYRGRVEDTSLDVDIRLMTVNYLGHVAITKAVLPYMIKEGGGHIIGVSSIQGKISIPYRSAYSASKHAFQAFFDCLRAEVCDKNITVSVLSPSYIKTNLSLNALKADGTQYNVMDKTTEQGMSPEYVAKKILDTVLYKQQDICLTPLHHKIAVFLRAVFPNLFFKLMASRALKQRSEYCKVE